MNYEKGKNWLSLMICMRCDVKSKYRNFIDEIYFLKKFIESYPKEANDYYFITLHPVNYVVEDNKDVIEYIKRDILFQLIKDDKIYDYKDGVDKIFDSVCNIESLDKLADFLSSILPVPGLADGYEKAKKLVATIRDEFHEQSDLNVVDDYLNGLLYGAKSTLLCKSNLT